MEYVNVPVWGVILAVLAAAVAAFLCWTKVDDLKKENNYMLSTKEKWQKDIENEQGRAKKAITELSDKTVELTQAKAAIEDKDELLVKSGESLKKVIKERDVYRKRLIPEDLTMIPGIGAKMNKKLNEVGIYNVEQVAKMTPEAVVQLQDDVNVPRATREKYDWVASAQEWLDSLKDEAA